MIDGQFQIAAGAQGQIVQQNIRRLAQGGHGYEIVELECVMGANGLFNAEIPYISGSAGHYAIKVGTGDDAPGQTFRLTAFAFLGRLVNLQFSSVLFQQAGLQSANVAPTAMASGVKPSGRVQVIVDQSGVLNAGEEVLPGNAVW